MERGNPYLFRAFPHKRRRTFTHLGCSLVCKRERENIPRLYAMFDEVCNAICEHPCFAAACARKHKQRAIQAFHSGALFVV